MPRRAARPAPTCFEAGVARVVIALGDPDPRTNGQGIARLRDAGIEVVEGIAADAARAAMAGFLTRRAAGRPFVTLKLATSLDGRIALASGESRWITGPEARAHAHLERARHEAILVGRRTAEIDRPSLDVRLAGLEVARAAPPDPVLHRRRALPPERHRALEGVDHLLVEGGAETAAAFLREGPGRSPAALPRADPDRRGQVRARRSRPRRSRRRAWPLAAHRHADAWQRPARSLRERLMFTGIVTDIGTIAAATQQGDLRVEVSTSYDVDTIDLGASISCSGVCLTVVDKAPGRVAFDVSAETDLAHRADMWTAGRRLNLERALRLGDELGGHIVTGHVDGIGTVAEWREEGGSHRADHRRRQGARALCRGQGLDHRRRRLAHRQRDRDTHRASNRCSTSFPTPPPSLHSGRLQPGQAVNLEIDVLARYLQRMEALRGKA
jgi:riboflavin synthase